MVSATISSWTKETMKFTHSYHQHAGESLKSVAHAKVCHPELEITFTNHKLKIIVMFPSNLCILTYPADWETQTIPLSSILANTWLF